ncbi:Kiwa anti-phage protein KwaB-like domain-containing protein [Metaclostridioides mangenotii]|uniref:Kiwa anti-phage protein KwaB-like domain-containing protein n=1 Tax=Metaclostridioides mangenotii TaxID=1540 RepID=UPI0026E9D537|nr:Kiwa anti-phage protein KwaB-like domain-containing protein [Clostridioides mangenotii]
MDINKIVQVLGSNEINLRLYFTAKKPNDKYYSYSPLVRERLQKELINLTRSYLTGFISKEQLMFNPISSMDDTIEYCDIGYIGNYDDVIESYRDINCDRTDIIPGDINKLTFYCMEISYTESGQNKYIRLFRRVTKFKKLSKSGILGLIKNNEFSKLDNNILGLDGFTDIVVFENEVLILNRISLERIFSIHDQYERKAKETISVIKEIDKIENFDQFEEDCLSDKRIKKTLTKMADKWERLEQSLSNFEKIEDTIDMFDLDIDVDVADSKKIIYENKEQLKEILRLIGDAYYKSVNLERIGVDDIG